MNIGHVLIPPDYSISYNGDNDTYEFRKNCTVEHKPYIVTVKGHNFRCWSQGSLIQNAMPELSAEQREFLISGKTPAEWDKLFANCEED